MNMHVSLGYERKPSPWTEERQMMLSNLWGQGSSAAEIAGLLNCGVSRSAVIGRARRQNLERRFETILWPADDTEKLRALWLAGVSIDQIILEIGRPGRDGDVLTRSAIFAKAGTMGLPGRKRTRVRKEESKTRVAGTAIVTPECDLSIPQEQRKTFAQLEQHDCRWPVGDPDKEDFFFCGAKKMQSGSYCVSHHVRSRA